MRDKTNRYQYLIEFDIVLKTKNYIHIQTTDLRYYAS